MARVFVTGSSDGLGFGAAQQLVREGHTVVLHARSEARAAELRRKLSAPVVVADVATVAAMKSAAHQVNALGPVDAVIHNVAIGYTRAERHETADGLEEHFAVNTLAPYVLTALVPAKHLVYLSSGRHRSGRPSLDDAQWKERRWSGSGAYSDTKLQDLWLAFAIARKWPTVRANAVDPGWVATKMGGAGAPDDFGEGVATQVWLATGGTDATGQYFRHKKAGTPLPAAHDVMLQEELLALCANVSGVALPARAPVW
jgi:NAD(P)-dependent dehydrogenase (short-subunit alcohol dehydrogenase family)